jgi:hypothetical protein
MRPTDDELRQHLRGTTFPAQRSGLVAAAIAAGGPEGIVENLRALPGDHLFSSAQEIAEAVRPSTQERIEP